MLNSTNRRYTTLLDRMENMLMSVGPFNDEKIDFDKVFAPKGSMAEWQPYRDFVAEYKALIKDVEEAIKLWKKNSKVAYHFTASVNGSDYVIETQVPVLQQAFFQSYAKTTGNMVTPLYALRSLARKWARERNAEQKFAKAS